MLERVIIRWVLNGPCHDHNDVPLLVGPLDAGLETKQSSHAEGKLLQHKSITGHRSRGSTSNLGRRQQP